VYALYQIDCPVFDHSTSTPPFRIELSRVKMQLLQQEQQQQQQQQTAASPQRASTGQLDAAAAAAAADDDDDRLSARLTGLVIGDARALEDMQSKAAAAAGEAAVFTLSVRAACIEGESGA